MGRDGLSRRELFSGAATFGAALGLRRLGGRPAPVRITGRVLGAGKAVPGATVSDGLSVVATEVDGRFALVSDGRRPFVSVSQPAGYEIPVSPAGTARLHQAIVPDARGEASVRFDLTPLHQSDERHAFLVLADPQTENAWEMGRFHSETVPDVRGTLKSLGDVPLLGVTDGDIMYDNLGLFPEYQRAVAAMGIPFFQVVGNHDLDLDAQSDEASTATFGRYFGPTYYSFNRGRVHYVVLDDVFYYGGGFLGYLPAEQLTWLAGDLSRVERGSPVVVFLHIPLESSLYLRRGSRRPETSNSVSNRSALLELLLPFRAHLISGHTHECEHRLHGAVPEHTLGAVCGAWWTGDIGYDGSPNGYAVFEVAEEELKWRFKATGQLPAVQARVYPAGSDPAAPSEIVANVWDWDPTWTVTWFENGERRGAMTRQTGLDPWSVRLHTGPDLPPRRGWVDPEPTAHLFRASVGVGTPSITVEIRTRFGDVYGVTPLPLGGP